MTADDLEYFGFVVKLNQTYYEKVYNQTQRLTARYTAAKAAYDSHIASTSKEGATAAERAARIRSAESALYAKTNNFNSKVMQEINDIRSSGGAQYDDSYKQTMDSHSSDLATFTAAQKMQV